jgi:hypothetical protein
VGVSVVGAAVAGLLVEDPLGFSPAFEGLPGDGCKVTEPLVGSGTAEGEIDSLT